MKKLAAILLAVLLLLSLSACSGPGTEPGDQTTAAGDPAGTRAGDPSGSADPGETDDPYPTQSPERAVFDPETDFDNRYAELWWSNMVETPEAYYLHSFNDCCILYWDRVAGEGGVFCNLPQCTHESNSCPAYVNGLKCALAYEQGRLWWVDAGVHFYTVYSINPDGSDKREHGKIAFDERFWGDTRFYFHRGALWSVNLFSEIRGGESFDTARLAYMDLEKFEYHEVLSRRGLLMNMPSVRFIGDDVYFFATSNTCEAVEGELTAEFLQNLERTEELIRWNREMKAPQTVYSRTFKGYGEWNDGWFYVSRDGTAYFISSALKEPDQDWDEKTNPYVHTIWRIGENNTKAKVMDLCDGEDSYYYAAMSEDVIFAYHGTWKEKQAGRLDAWILNFAGETIYKGPLPLEYRAELPRGRFEFDGFHDCWVTKDTLMLCCEEDEGTGIERYYIVKYDVTPEGLTETVLAEPEQSAPGQ